MSDSISGDRAPHRRHPPLRGVVTCPFLWTVVADHMWLYPTPGYCRVPSGRVRVPSPETLARVCTNGLHHDCPAYRSSRRTETAGTSVV